MLEKQLEQIRAITDFKPEIAIVLGSGLGGLAEKCEVVCKIDYSKIEGMPVSTAPTHRGEFIFGYLEGRRVVLMNGRVHLYEGYTAEQTVMPIRLTRLMGAETLVLTNASGGIRKDLNAGDFMLISDHISCFIDSPLIGKNDDSLGTRFPDMSNAYDRELRARIKANAVLNGTDLKEGVYVQLKGPQFESPAEIKMLSALGADAVGMSTVCETIAAVHCGFKVCAVSVIANLACGILDKPLTSEEVSETADSVADDFERLIKSIVRII